jgi:hypothetical protein
VLVLLAFLAACFVGGALAKGQPPSRQVWWVTGLGLAVGLAYYVFQAL